MEQLVRSICDYKQAYTQYGGEHGGVRWVDDCTQYGGEKAGGRECGVIVRWVDDCTQYGGGRAGLWLELDGLMTDWVMECECWPPPVSCRRSVVETNG